MRRTRADRQRAKVEEAELLRRHREDACQEPLKPRSGPCEKHPSWVPALAAPWAPLPRCPRCAMNEVPEGTPADTRPWGAEWERSHVEVSLSNPPHLRSEGRDVPWRRVNGGVQPGTFREQEALDRIDELRALEQAKIEGRDRPRGRHRRHANSSPIPNGGPNYWSH